MVYNNIGYIINESAITGFTDTNIISEKNGRLIGEGILQSANEKNRNGRYYPSEELFPQLTCPRTLELLEAGYLRAELGHPLSNELVRQQTIDDSRTCAQFLKLWTSGNEVWARFRGTNNAFGESFDKDLRDGCKPAWSLRALGNIVNTPRGAEVHNLRVITWDQVIYPSHPNAYTHRVITESASLTEDIPENRDKLIPFGNSDVIALIKNESMNYKTIKENFDFAYNSITLDEDTSHIILTGKDGSIYYVNLENYIADSIRDYAAGRSSLLN